MITGAVIAGFLALAVYFASKLLINTQRERIAASAIVSGAVCISTAGFLVDSALGFLAVGLNLVAISLLLGYEQSE
jgi:hypothetical protein